MFQSGCVNWIDFSSGVCWAGISAVGTDNLETQPWLPSPEDLVNAWGEVEKKEAELRNREKLLAEQERAQRTLRSQEKLRQQLQDQEARRLRALEASRAGESLPVDAKPAASLR